MFITLQDKFEIDTSDPHVILTVDDMIQHRLSDYRSDLYKHYKKFDTREEALQNAPLEVTIDEWKVLCERFSSEKFQVIYISMYKLSILNDKTN